MEWRTREWILDIGRKCQDLREAAEALDKDVNQSSPFDLDDARAYFEDVKKACSDLDGLLSWDGETDEAEGE